MRRGIALVVALVAGLTFAGPRAQAAFHEMVIQEVFPGTTANPNAQFVELRMFSGGQNVVGGHKIRYFSASGGMVAEYTFPSSVPNGADDERVLACTTEAVTLFGLTCDMTIGANLPFPSGKVTFDAPDAAAYGSFTGSTSDSGPPAGFLVRGRSLQLKIQSGGIDRATAGDTNNSRNDYHYTAPNPKNNARATGSLPAGDADSDGDQDGADNCPDHSNTSQADADVDGLGDPCDFGPDPDTTPPATTLSVIDGGPCSSCTTFSFTSSEPGTFQCSLDGAAFATCTSPRTVCVADGSHTFRVRAVDAAGNADATPASFTWTADTTPPDTTITSGPSGEVTSTTATFTFTATEPTDDFSCSIDGSPVTGCRSPATYTGLSLGGPHTFSVRARDGCGRADPTPAERSWTIVRGDTTPPDTTILSGPPAYTSSADALFEFESSEPGSTFECSMNGAPYVACATPHTAHVLSGSFQRFEVRAVDAAGNRDPTPAEWTWRVDATPPLMELVRPTAGLCVLNQELLALDLLIVVGACDFVATVSDPESGIERVWAEIDDTAVPGASYDADNGTASFHYHAMLGFHKVCLKARNRAGIDNDACAQVLGVPA